LALPLPAASNTVVINARCSLDEGLAAPAARGARPGRRATRPKLFSAMIKDGFDLLTYRKGRGRRINERRFIRRRAPSSTGAGWTTFCTTSPWPS
jgi:hypothetical protein